MRFNFDKFKDKDNRELWMYMVTGYIFGVLTVVILIYTQ